MITPAERNGEKHITSKDVKAFPQFFRAFPYADHMTAIRFWRSCGSFELIQGRLKRVGKTTCITPNTVNGLKQVTLKANIGRERKRTHWVNALHLDPRDKFYQLRKAGIKISFSTLRLLSLNLI